VPFLSYTGIGSYAFMQLGSEPLPVASASCHAPPRPLSLTSYWQVLCVFSFASGSASMSERTVRELGAALGVVISVGCGFYIIIKDLPLLQTPVVGSRRDMT
jgi:hypothetical protein